MDTETKIINFIDQYKLNHYAIPPTVREIADGCNLTVNKTYRTLKRLHREKQLVKHRGVYTTPTYVHLSRNQMLKMFTGEMKKQKTPA